MESFPRKLVDGHVVHAFIQLHVGVQTSVHYLIDTVTTEALQAGQAGGVRVQEAGMGEGGEGRGTAVGVQPTEVAVELKYVGDCVGRQRGHVRAIVFK